MGKEFELKFSASAESLDKISAAFDGGEVISMNTTYFDTPAGTLSARKWTLRLRKENGESVITLKTAGDGVTRGEWEYAAETLADAAARLVFLGAPEELEALLQEGVEPVCGAEFTRRAITVEHCGTVLELALDRGRLFRGEKSLPLCEVEVELKHGSEAACRGFAGELAEKYDLQPEPRSKFVRAVTL